MKIAVCFVTIALGYRRFEGGRRLFERDPCLVRIAIEFEQAQHALGRVGRKHVVLGHLAVGRGAVHSQDTCGRTLADAQVVAQRRQAAARDAQLDDVVGLLSR